MSDFTQLGGTASAEAEIHVTPRALEKVREALAREGNRGGLRLGVLGGGCSGLSYQFKFNAEARPRDHVFEFDGITVFVDPKSMAFLSGLTLDWKDTLMESCFVFQNPNAKKTCGCGTSFSV